MTNIENQPETWLGDVLNRKPTGDFLYKLVLQRFATYHAKPGTGALCIALDADWGAGKSFFIQKWSADIQALNHPVIHFDAWVNDLADDPLLGFMAELQRSFGPWIKQLPIGQKVKKEAGEKLKGLMKHAGKAVLPALGVLGKGMLKKGLAIDADHLQDVISKGIDADDIKSIGGATLEKFFEEAMKSHTDKQSAIKALKKSLEGLLTYLGQQPEITLPMFVFVDELDRCRPDYAIRLLEGIKHLFDAQGICFVFATNLSQLSESAKAVYGPGFDGYRYLKRFFAFDYRLPEPDHSAYALKLIRESSLAGGRLHIKCGSPPNYNTDELSTEAKLQLDFSLVAQAFDLDLRSQEQVFRLAEAATTGLLNGAALYSLYMFFLAATYAKGPKAFDALSQPQTATTFINSLRPISVEYRKIDHFGRPKEPAITHFSRLIEIYHSTSAKAIEDIGRTGSEQDYHYPDSLRTAILDEHRSYTSRQRPSIAAYYDLMRAAGQIKSKTR